MALDVRSLRSFVGIAESGSFSRAADALHTAQPGLSLQIQKLEDELGVRLFQRSRKGVVLTGAGERLLRHARLILGQLQAARDDLRMEAAEPIGPVVLGMPQSLAASLVVPLVRDVLERWPRIALRVVDVNTGYIPDWLRSGHLDLGLVFRAESGQGVAYQELLQEELILVGPPRELQQSSDITLADVSKLPLLLPSRRHSLRELIESYARRSGLQLNVIGEIDAMPQLRDLAMVGAGFSILSYASVRRDIEEGRIAGTRIVDPVLLRSVYLSRASTAPTTRPIETIQGAIAGIVDRLAESGQWPKGPTTVRT